MSWTRIDLRRPLSQTKRRLYFAMPWRPTKTPSNPPSSLICLPCRLPDSRKKSAGKIPFFVCQPDEATIKGHVLKIDRLADEDSIHNFFLNRYTQLPNYSEMDEVKEHPTFRTITGNDTQERSPQVEISPDVMVITHVSYIAWMSSSKWPHGTLWAENVSVGGVNLGFFSQS